MDAETIAIVKPELRKLVENLPARLQDPETLAKAIGIHRNTWDNAYREIRVPQETTAQKITDFFLGPDHSPDELFYRVVWGR